LDGVEREPVPTETLAQDGAEASRGQEVLDGRHHVVGVPHQQAVPLQARLNGHSAEPRLEVRREHSARVVHEFEAWQRTRRDRTSRKSGIGKAIDYALKRWTALSRFLTDGRICISNNAAERALRGIALGRHNWTFAGSDRGGERAAAMSTLIETAKLNGVDPLAWLADVLTRLADHPARRLEDLFLRRWHQLEASKNLGEGGAI